jgi:uncharacterized membrane protein YqaE (UPF0057 family)
MRKILTRTVLLFTCTFLLSQFSFAAVIVPEPSKTDSATAPALWKPNETEVSSAVDEFKSLSRSDRKARTSEAKALVKQYNKDKKHGKTSDGETNTILLCILALLLPPLAVYLKTKSLDWRFWVSILLTLCFWIPGVVFAFLVVFDAI